MFPSFIVDGDLFRSNYWFISWCTIGAKRSKFWRISELCEALEGFKFFNSFRISSSETWLKVKALLVFYLSLIILILAWFLYFSIAFKTGSAIFSALVVGSSSGGSFRSEGYYIRKKVVEIFVNFFFFWQCFTIFNHRYFFISYTSNLIMLKITVIISFGFSYQWNTVISLNIIGPAISFSFFP